VSCHYSPTTNKSRKYTIHTNIGIYLSDKNKAEKKLTRDGIDTHSLSDNLNGKCISKITRRKRRADIHKLTIKNKASMHYTWIGGRK